MYIFASLQLPSKKTSRKRSPPLIFPWPTLFQGANVNERPAAKSDPPANGEETKGPRGARCVQESMFFFCLPRSIWKGLNFLLCTNTHVFDVSSTSHFLQGIIKRMRGVMLSYVPSFFVEVDVAVLMNISGFCETTSVEWTSSNVWFMSKRAPW